MTNHPRDLQNTDCALIIGSNAAENHPILFKWIMKAKEKGAKVISVDPRFTRTSSQADIYAPIRPGTDIAFIGGLINYVIEKNLYHKDYVVNYTDWAFLVDPGFEFKDGLYSGYNKDKRSYDRKTWAYRTEKVTGPDGKESVKYLKDETLQDPYCVFQILKKHYARYTPDMVSKVTGMPKEKFLEIAKTFGATGAPDKTGSINYAMGTTQHTKGSQNVRSYAILQLLLGNIGRQGGGVNALRGHSNVQGSTDLAALFHIVPGYMAIPNDAAHKSLKDYNEKETPKAGFWVNKPKFFISLLKAFYGRNATKENDFGYNWLPKIAAGKNYSHIALFQTLYEGKIKGMFVFGQNPMIDGPNSDMEAKAMSKLEWLVNVDLFENETSSFWKRPGTKPEDIKTEVFLLPAASFDEKAGTATNTGRLIQWRDQAVEPKGESKSDLWIAYNLGLAIRKAYANSNLPEDEPVLKMTWDYGSAQNIYSADPDVYKVAHEINGFDVNTGKGLAGFGNLKDDGTTASGCWIYCGYFVSRDDNRSRRRGKEDPSGVGSYLNWGWAWPMNRRIIYNRASADPNGQPWSDKKKYLVFDTSKADPTKKQKGLWSGPDVPDFVPSRAPDDPGGKAPFIMLPEGVGKLFGQGMADGPLPEHYEPLETPVKNAFSSHQLNPVAKVWNSEMDKVGEAAKFPIVASTWRLTEHMHGYTRNFPWSSELQPKLFVEISPTLAAAKGIKTGDQVIVSSARAEIRALALVTPRMAKLKLGDQEVEQVGLPWHFGHEGIVTGDIVNRLTPHIGDANTMIPEYKAFLVDVKKGGAA